MPSFEHAEKDNAQSHEDSLYQPGKNRPSDNEETTETANEALMPTTQLVTRKGDVAAAAELAAVENEERQAARDAIASRPPCYIDAHLGDPAPTIQQSIRVKPLPTGPRKPGLRGRKNASGTSNEGVKGGSTFGEVETPSAAKETLSGNRVQDGKVTEPEKRERPQREKRQRDTSSEAAESSAEAPAKTDTAENSDANSESRPPRKRSRNRNRNRNRNKDENTESGDKREARAPKNEHKPRPQQQQNKRPANKKPEPKAQEPTGLIGKIKKIFGGLFGDSSAPQAKESPKTSQPDRKPRQNQGKGRPNGGRQGQGHGKGRGPRPQGQQQDGEGPSKPRRRRGGRRRGSQNRPRQGGQGGSQNNQPQSSGDAS